MMNLPLAHIEAKFMLDGKTYEVEKFKVKFSQPVDFKGQPQHETFGGKLTVVLNQMADNNLLLWSKTSNMLKNGSLLFQTDLGITVLRVEFEKAYCITMSRKINAMTGTLTTLVISPEIVIMNDVAHDNFWPK